jgi:hypothetical protein
MFEPKINLSQILIVLILFTSGQTSGQLLQPPPGGNKKASVSEWVGLTHVKIDYDRPAVNGREDKIWGKVVHYGFADLNYGTSKAAPWRAGANENTTIEFSDEVFIEGKSLPAGKYGFFIAMYETKATLILSSYNTAWGSFYYDPEDDVLRVDVPVIKVNENVEWLKYEFSDQTENAAIIYLYWEKVKIPFKISVDLPKQQIATYRKAFNAGEFHRYWQKMHAAANYCLVNTINLEEGLTWADRSINTYFGEANFLTLSTYAGLLEKLNRKAEADSVFQKALPMATMLQLNTYGRNLIRQNKFKEAFAIFKLNYDKHPHEITPIIGMIRGYYYTGNSKAALVYADKVMALLPDTNSQAFISKMIQDIKAGKDI